MARSTLRAPIPQAHGGTHPRSRLPGGGGRWGMLKGLHTADWHVGRSFSQFEPEHARKVARDRLSVIDRILGLADQYDVHVVLCAGDLFDSPTPDEPWWRGLAHSFGRRKTWTRPVVLLPGNHDPLTRDS